MRLNSDIEEFPAYPFLRVAEARRAAEARGVEVLDLSLGQPTGSAPAVVRDALLRAASEVSLCEYPLTEGLPELREAIAAWIARRFGITLDPLREVLPTLGAKEPIALLARLFAQAGDTIAVASPSYPVPDRSARAAGRRVATQVLSA
jgi:aspartate/methionine/tyrosine aminotransferase